MHQAFQFCRPIQVKLMGLAYLKDVHFGFLTVDKLNTDKTPNISIYIVIHRQTVSSYHNSSEWLDT